MIRLVSWDWNGTVLADTQALMDAGNHIIKTYGGTPIPRKQYAATFDFPTIDFYCNQGCNREALINSEFGKEYYSFYESRASKCRTRKGTREVLNWLKDKSIDSIILSNNIEESITNQLVRLDLTEYFSEILANTELGATQSGNNKINRMAAYLSHTKHDPAEATVIGDSPEDIGIGKILGMKTIAITDGYYSTPRLRASNPDHIITSLAEVIKIIEIL